MEQNKNIFFNIFPIAVYVKFWINSIQTINPGGPSSVQD
jgi:hypothetical protein